MVGEEDEELARPGLVSTPVATTSPAPGRLGLAWNARVGGLPREFWFVWTGTLVNRLGTFVQTFLVLYLTGERGVSEKTAGYILALHGGCAIGGQLIGGVLADRVGRPQTFLVGSVAFAGSLGVLGIADALPLIVLGAALTGLSADVTRPASQALIADIVPPEQRARAFGLNFWAVNLGFAIATYLAGVLAERGYGLLFAGDALTTLFAGVLVWRFVGDTRPPKRDGHEPGSWLAPFRDTLMLRIIVAWLCYAVVYFQVFIVLPLSMLDDGLTKAQFGGVVAMNGILIVVVQPLVLSWLARLPRVPMLAFSFLLVGAGFGLNAFADHVWQYVVCLVVWTLGEIGSATVGTAIVSDIAPPGMRGRYAGAFGIAFGAAGIVAPIAGTQVFHAFGPNAVWAGCAVLGAITFVMTMALDAPVRARTAP